MTASMHGVDPLRRRIMAAVRGRDTKPELIVRRLLFSLGHRYRLHRKDLPGRPDIVFVGRRKAIFVHGCFWHRHRGCPKSTTPKTRERFWAEKFEKNVDRDRAAERRLAEMGWTTLVVWECETHASDALARKLTAFLDSSSPSGRPGEIPS